MIQNKQTMCENDVIYPGKMQNLTYKTCHPTFTPTVSQAVYQHFAYPSSRHSDRYTEGVRRPGAMVPGNMIGIAVRLVNRARPFDTAENRAPENVLQPPLACASPLNYIIKLDQKSYESGVEWGLTWRFCWQEARHRHQEHRL
jgi:hypothetical protein